MTSNRLINMYKQQALNALDDMHEHLETAIETVEDYQCDIENFDDNDESIYGDRNSFIADINDVITTLRDLLETYARVTHSDSPEHKEWIGV